MKHRILVTEKKYFYPQRKGFWGWRYYKNTSTNKRSVLSAEEAWEIIEIDEAKRESNYSLRSGIKWGFSIGTCITILLIVLKYMEMI